MSEGREAAVAPFPVVIVTIDDNGVAVNGEEVEREPDQSPREAAIDAVSRRVARALRRPVRTIAEDYTGRTRLVVHPDGHVSDVASLGDAGVGNRKPHVPGIERAEYTAADLPDSARQGNPVNDESETQPVPPALLEQPHLNGLQTAAVDASPAEAEPTYDDDDQRAGEEVQPTPDQPWADRGHAADPFVGDDAGDPSASSPEGPIKNPWITAATVVNGGPGSETDRQRARRKSFIAAQPLVGPAQTGPRGLLTRMGMRTHPSRREMEQRDSVRKVSQHWPGPRTIAIANPKGSANKTPTMICLSAIFGRYGGAGVLGWDNNETRGTAAWRTHRGPHAATVLDLLPLCGELLGPRAQAAQLAHYVHHQAIDKYDVLWSDQSTESEHEVTGDEVDRIHEVAAKYYRLIIIDSGNSERASNWRSMIKHADQLVVPCTNVEDTAEAGARMLEALAQRDEHSATLAKSAVAVVSQRTPGRDPNMDRIIHDFGPLVRDVVAIPHDPGLYSGVINFDALQPSTRRAWLNAAAAVAINL